jgi:hypothetical protein
MAVTYGFFNSIDHDRVYNADQMSTYFKGLISQGVFENVGGALQVTASDGLTVQVQTGRAIIGDVLKWVENDTVMNLTINPAHVTLNRYTAVIIQCDINNRVINITTKDGANATDPIKPNMVNTATMKELCLAYIYVKAGTSVITQANIQDTRANKNLCGWVTGLVDQVDTTTLFDQWSAAYTENIAEMESWEVTQKTAFENWLSTLTQQLTVGAYVKEYKKVVTLQSSDSRTIDLDMTGYTQENSDVFLIYLNGLKGIESVDYTIGTGSVTVNCNGADDVIEIVVIKSILGVPA